jgi:phosphatidylinositol alpha-1,6-mannosyltransferase
VTPGDPRTLLLLATDFPPATGGIQTLTWEVYGRLGDLMRLAVAPASGAPAAGESGWRLRRARRACGGGWTAAAYLREAAALLAPEAAPPCLLHCNHVQAALAGWWLRRRHGVRYVVWVHGEELTKHRFPRLAGVCLRGAAAVIANSRFTAERARDLMGRRGPEVRIVPLGAPAEWLAAPPSEGGHGDRAPVILTVARLSRRDAYKGIDVALRAVAALKAQGVAARYRIAGEGDDRARLEALARELGVDDRAEFLGHVPDAALRAAYDEADVFLLCSREELSGRGLGFEGFGIALAEAAARARPAVAGRSGGIVDVVADGETGLLVDPRSAAAVAEALARLLHDPALRRRMGAQARRRAQSEFRWDITAARVRALHEELVRA